MILKFSMFNVFTMHSCVDFVHVAVTVRTGTLCDITLRNCPNLEKADLPLHYKTIKVIY